MQMKAQSKSGEPFGVARPACFERLAGVLASLAALTRVSDGIIKRIYIAHRSLAVLKLGLSKDSPLPHYDILCWTSCAIIKIAVSKDDFNNFSLL